MLKVTIQALKGIMLKKDFEVIMTCFGLHYIHRTMYCRHQAYIYVSSLDKLIKAIQNIEKSYLKKTYCLTFEIDDVIHERYIGIPFK